MTYEILNKEEWEKFLNNCSQKTFLSSWDWGEFQMAQGHTIKRFGVVENSALKAVALAVKIKARRGTYILIQHGPTVIETGLTEKRKILEELFFGLAAHSAGSGQPSPSGLVEWAKIEGASFIRCAPLLERNADNKKLFRDLGFIDAPMHANAYEATWKLDITPAEDALMAGMRKTTRYLIRQAQKNPDIRIEKSDKTEDIAIYQKLNREVAKRQRFTAFSDDYIKKEFEVFAKDGQVSLFFGKIKEKTAAGAMVIFWQGTAYYHQAASLAKYAKFSIPYLLQWEAIKEAKARGCRTYDFWGYTDPQKNPKHPWAGPTLFKMGFGGKAFEYVKTQDLPLTWKYWPTCMFEILRKIKREL